MGVNTDKLINKFLTNKNHITMEDCDTLLIGYGYKPHKSSGSHQGYFRKDSKPIIIPRPHGTKYINILYVNRIINILHLEAE
jgi:hypothetical protein